MGRTLIRPDGSTVRVNTDAEAETLRTLGYRDESPQAEIARHMEAGQQNYYSSPGQRALTALEGAASGLTLGLADLAMDDEATRERARVNPGTRLASEIVGGLAPLAPGVVGSALRFTPAGALARGSATAGEVLGRGSKTATAIIRGATEGAGIGAGQALTTATLQGDPITAESILAGVGWGAVFGGGLGALGAGVEQKFEARAARAAQAEAAEANSLLNKERADVIRAKNEAVSHGVTRWNAEVDRASIGALEDGAFSRFQGSIDDANKTLKEFTPTPADIQPPNLLPLGSSQKTIYSKLVESHNINYVKKDARAMAKTFALAQQAAKEGKYEKMITQLEKFKDTMISMETGLGGRAVFSAEKAIGQANDLIGQAKLRVDTAMSATEEALNLTAVREGLSHFPRTTEAFSKLGNKEAERLAASIDQLGKLKSAELAGVQDAVRASVDDLASSLGVVIEGTPGTKFAGVWKAVKDGRTVRSKEATKLATEGNLLWDKVSTAQRAKDKAALDIEGETVRRGGNRSPFFLRHAVGSWAAQKAGGGIKGIGAYAVGSHLVSGLVNLKGAVLGSINAKANKWMPKVGRGIQKAASRTNPYLVRLNGTMEEQQASKLELMQRRAKEITEAAPVVRDTLYRSLQPLGISHPELAAAMHAHAVKRFQFLYSKLPKDPGLAYSNLKSIWKPDAVAVEKFGRYYDAFQNPVGVIQRALDVGKITMEEAEGLREMDPELYSYLRSAMLIRVSDPEVASRMTYNDQVHLGLMLNTPFHSTMDPRFMAAQQQMFTERNQPLEMNPRIQPGGGAGRPSGPGPSATAGQKITER